MDVAACWVLANDPTSRPIDMNDSVPAMTTGIAIHHEAVSLSPKYGVVAMARNTTSWTSATATLMPTRASTTAPVLTGASRSRRSSLFLPPADQRERGAERAAGGDRPAEQAGGQVLDGLE